MYLARKNGTQAGFVTKDTISEISVCIPQPVHSGMLCNTIRYYCYVLLRYKDSLHSAQLHTYSSS